MALTKVTYPIIEDFSADGVNAVPRNLEGKVRDIISVKDFGAVGDGITDDTVAIQNCISAVSDVGVEGGGVQIIFPKGTYLCNVALNGTINNTEGEYGICLSGYGATLKGRSTDKSIITINNAEAGTPDPNPGGSIYVNGTTIEGFTLDMSDMANAASTYAIAAEHMYHSSVRDIHVIGEPALGGGLYIGSQCYTWLVSNYDCARISISGYDASNMTTSLVFHDIAARQVVMKNVFSLSFFGGVVQGDLDHFVLTSNCQAITVMGMDLETGNPSSFCYNFGSDCRYVTSIGNSPGGYSVNSYSTGYAPNSNLLDRPSINPNLQAIGVYGRADSQGKVEVQATPEAIYYFKDTLSGQNHGLFLITGDNGSDGFQDLIMVGFGVVTVIKSQNLYGSPAARTYTNSSNTLFGSYAAGVTKMRPVALIFLDSVV